MRTAPEIINWCDWGSNNAEIYVARIGDYFGAHVLGVHNRIVELVDADPNGIKRQELRQFRHRIATYILLSRLHGDWN